MPAPSCPTSTTLTLLRRHVRASAKRSSKYFLTALCPLRTTASGGSAHGLPSIRSPGRSSMLFRIFSSRLNMSSKRHNWRGTDKSNGRVGENRKADAQNGINLAQKTLVLLCSLRSSRLNSSSLPKIYGNWTSQPRADMWSLYLLEATKIGKNFADLEKRLSSGWWDRPAPSHVIETGAKTHMTQRSAGTSSHKLYEAIHQTTVGAVDIVQQLLVP